MSVERDGRWADMQAADKRAEAAEAALVTAREALTEIGCISINETPCNERTDGYEGCTRCAALAATQQQGAQG